jgi:hypothetical protein
VKHIILYCEKVLRSVDRNRRQDVIVMSAYVVCCGGGGGIWTEVQSVELESGGKLSFGT